MNDSLCRMLIKLRLSGLSQSLEVRRQEAAGNRLLHVRTGGAKSFKIT